jgi:hypothetical protein
MYSDGYGHRRQLDTGSSGYSSLVGQIGSLKIAPF